MVSGGSSGEIVFSDVFKRKCLKKVLAHDMGVNWVEFSRIQMDENVYVLASVGQDALIKLWTITIMESKFKAWH